MSSEEWYPQHSCFNYTLILLVTFFNKSYVQHKPFQSLYNTSHERQLCAPEIHCSSSTTCYTLRMYRCYEMILLTTCRQILVHLVNAPVLLPLGQMLVHLSTFSLAHSELRLNLFLLNIPPSIL